MPRLTHIIHPYYGRLPVNPIGQPCPACGVEGRECYLMCDRSPAYYSADQERDDALRTEAEIAQVGFQAWDSAQHRAHGLPCPYDGYPDGDTLAYEAVMDDPPAKPAYVFVPFDGDDLPF